MTGGSPLLCLKATASFGPVSDFRLSSRRSVSWVGAETPASVEGAVSTFARLAPGDCSDSSIPIARRPSSDPTQSAGLVEKEQSRPALLLVVEAVAEPRSPGCPGRRPDLSPRRPQARALHDDRLQPRSALSGLPGAAARARPPARRADRARHHGHIGQRRECRASDADAY